MTFIWYFTISGITIKDINNFKDMEVNNMNSIAELIKEINTEKYKVSDFINTPRYQIDFLKDLSKWNQICSSLYVLGDTLQAIQAYIESSFPTLTGLKYIYIYGLLQALFIQQDAIKHLSEAFSITLSDNIDFKKIRTIRNATIGHPTKLGENNKRSYNYIVQISMEKDTFTFEQYTSTTQSDNLFTVNLHDLMTKQLHGILLFFKEITIILRQRDNLHKDLFKELKMESYFSHLDYYFEKVGEGIYNPSESNIQFAFSMLRGIEQTYTRFKEDLESRSELPAKKEIQFDFDLQEHALQKLKAYLSQDQGSSLVESDARIYLFFIRERNAYFKELAREIDEEYNNNQ